MREPTTKHREFSIRSILFGAVFVTALAVAIFVDVIGLFDLVKGSSVETLGMGAMITAAPSFQCLRWARRFLWTKVALKLNISVTINELFELALTLRAHDYTQ